MSLDDLRSIWSASTPSPQWDVESMWAKVRPDARETRPVPVRPASPRIVTAKPRHTRTQWIRFATAAAAAGVVVVAGITQREKLGLSSRTVTAQAPPPMHEYVTRRGERATIQLSDGSQLVLAAESRLRIPSDFGDKKRELFLDGEAVFDVAHDATRPFRVYIKDAVAQDIGTRFNLRAYGDDSVVTVAVAEGVVALAPRTLPVPVASRGPATATEGVLLRRGDVGTLGAGGRVSTIRDASIDRRLAWVDGRIHFTDRNLADVLRDIGRWYDVDVRVDDARLSSRPLTASFSIQSVDEMAEALALAVNARIERDGRVITLRSK
jgi:transmembrane sensor